MGMMLRPVLDNLLDVAKNPPPSSGGIGSFIQNLLSAIKKPTVTPNNQTGSFFDRLRQNIGTNNLDKLPPWLRDRLPNQIGIGDFERNQQLGLNSLPELSPDQINALAPKDRLTRSLNLAGFNQDELNRILAQRGYASGGYVNTDLTRTIPPISGPNPQGVESLFIKRYR